ncbi:hypothetical protein BJX66DRAFT_306648 [Aspergillus keveii]|uniref:Uncharacterized protein n=1 Tax=Aspergillus keveii TaxID=714993 RepID=A0ABR4G231_9EURO
MCAEHRAWGRSPQTRSAATKMHAGSWSSLSSLSLASSKHICWVMVHVLWRGSPAERIICEPASRAGFLDQNSVQRWYQIRVTASRNCSVPRIASMLGGLFGSGL